MGELGSALLAIEQARQDIDAVIEKPQGVPNAHAVALALRDAEPLVQAAADLTGRASDAPEPPEPDGDWTVLPDGDHGLKKLAGNYRAETPLGARITVPCELAAGAVADGLVFQKGVKAGEGARLEGCVARAVDDGIDVALHLAGEDSRAEWCEVTDYAHRGVLVGGEGARIADSWIHGQREGAASVTDSTGSLMFGGTHATDPDAQRPMGWVAERVLVEDVVWRSTLEVKGCGATVEDVTVLGGKKPADCYVRHGFGNVFRRVWVEGGGIQLGDRDNRADACRADDGVCFKKGGVTGDEMRKGAKGYPYAQDCVITDTDSEVITDWANGSGEDWAHMPEGSVVANVRGPITGKGPYDEDPSEMPHPVPPPPRRLSRDEVGPAARPRA
jgi:hypothetical protein